MTTVAIRIAAEERGALPLAGALHKAGCGVVDNSHVLSIDALRVQSESGPSSHDIARGGLGVVRVFSVQIVLADVDQRQLTELSQVHYFIDHALSERSLHVYTLRIS